MRDIPLFSSFAISMKALIYADGKNADWKTNPASYEIIEKAVTTNDILTIIMAKGGRQTVTFIPE